MNLSVGQLVYLLTKKDPKVYPALVCEEIKKKSLLGETTSYVVRLPTEDATEIELDKLDTEVFISVNQAREAMIARATDKIDFILKKAEEISTVFSEFITTGDTSTKMEDKTVSGLLEEEYATVDLGDGQVARINVSDIDKVNGRQDG